MTRKTLPKVITRPMAGLRAIADGAGAGQESPPSQPALPHDTVEPEPLDFSAPIANDLVPAAPVFGAQRFAAKRLSIARRIVSRHEVYATMGGLFPLPIVNVASVTAVIVRMLKQLSELYQIPFQRGRTRSMVIGLMGGVVPTGLGTVTATTLAFVVPGPALFGLGVTAITAAALTRGIGLVFVESFEIDAMSIEGSELRAA